MISEAILLKCWSKTFAYLFSQFCNFFFPFNGILNCLIDLITLNTKKKIINQKSTLDCIAQTKTFCLTELKFSPTNLPEETLMSDTHLPSELQTMLWSCKQCGLDIIEESLQSKNSLSTGSLNFKRYLCTWIFVLFIISHIFNKKQNKSVLRIAL